MTYIPYGRQEISDEDIAAVVDVLKSDYLTQGPMVPRFERAVAEYCGVEHAVAVNSATSALHIACLALGLGPGDVLWTSPVTFVASSNCALYCGAGVDFVDIDPVTWNMSVDALSTKLGDARSRGTLPKVVVPVHLMGQPCDMAAIGALAREYGFAVIEDASHAIGGRYGGEPIGSGRHSDVTVFSFHPVKVITTAEGGLAVTRNPALAASMSMLRSHGITRDPALMTHEPDGGWYYQQIALGFNYRLTELQAALGLSQFSRLDAFIKRRHELADRYDAAFASLPVMTPHRAPGTLSGLHLYVIRLRLNEIRRTHREVFDHLRAAGLGVNLHYIPVHTQPYYATLGFKPGDYPNAEQYYAEAISLPMFPSMTGADQATVIAAVKDALG